MRITDWQENPQATAALAWLAPCSQAVLMTTVFTTLHHPSAVSDCPNWLWLFTCQDHPTPCFWSLGVIMSSTQGTAALKRPLVPQKDWGKTGSINFDRCLRDTAEGDPACPSFSSCELPVSGTGGTWDALYYSAHNLPHLTWNFRLMQINSLFYFWEHQNQYDGTTGLQKSDYSTSLALLCILHAPHISSLAAKCSGFPFPSSVAASPTVSPALKYPTRVLTGCQGSPKKCIPTISVSRSFLQAVFQVAQAGLELPM